MLLDDVIKRLDHETAIMLLLAIAKEFPIIREILINTFNDHFKEEGSGKES
jgi:hypothetical protein